MLLPATMPRLFWRDFGNLARIPENTESHRPRRASIGLGAHAPAVR